MGKPNTTREIVTLVFVDTWKATCIERNYHLVSDKKKVLDIARKLHKHREERYVVISVEVGYEDNRWLNRLTFDQRIDLAMMGSEMFDFDLKEMPSVEG